MRNLIIMPQAQNRVRMSLNDYANSLQNLPMQTVL